MRYMVKVDFGKPTYGYWDGAVTVAYFSPESPHHPGKGHYVKFGSISANYWFTVKAGKSWLQAANAARMHLRAVCKCEAAITVVKEE